MFLGYLEKNRALYQSLEKKGYILIFKEISNEHGIVKGNCDAELVLQAMIDYEKYDKALIVSGDGDFACLVRYLKNQEKLEKVLIPNIHKYSHLLKKAADYKNWWFMNDLKSELRYEKTTRRTEP